MRALNWMRARLRPRRRKARGSYERKLGIEYLEDRQMLAAVDMGDFYYSGAEQIPLLRHDDQFVVRVAEESSREAVLEQLTAPEAPLAGYQPSTSLNPETVILSRSAGEVSVAVVDLAQIRNVEGVEWATPLFQAGENGPWIAVNDEVIVALKPEVLPDEFFGDEFESWRRLRGTSDQFVATLAEGAGLEGFAVANRLHSTDSRVEWASPNFHADIQHYFTPNDD